MFLRKLVARRGLRLYVSNQWIFFFIGINEIKGTIVIGVAFAEGKLLSNRTLIFDNPLRLGALMVRTWAVWHKNRYIGAGLAILCIGIFVNGGYFTINIVKSFTSKWFVRSTFDADVCSKPQTLWRVSRLPHYDSGDQFIESEVYFFGGHDRGSRWIRWRN
jgi:hypothetical protein